jgi:CheY-like chemotaxis protein
MSAEHPAEHIVHFYRDERDRCTSVAAFVLEGIERQQRSVILTTPQHWRSVCETLAASNNDAAVRHATFVDADELMRNIAGDGRIDAAGFVAAVEAMITSTGQPVRIFGDLVALLAQHGALDKALEVEQIGHQLSARHGIPILCAYNLEHLDHSGQHAHAIAAAHHRANPDLPKGSPQGAVVLLADDYDDTRDLYLEYLMANGYRVLTAASGNEAIRVARTWRPDLILMDIRMPDISGVEAMRILRQDAAFAKVPIVAFTANARETARSECLAAGFDAVIIKPCLPDLLLEHVARFCAAAP